VNRVLFIGGLACCIFAALVFLFGWTRPNNGWAIAVAVLGIGLIAVSRKKR
jgi:hypothetical protein